MLFVAARQLLSKRFHLLKIFGTLLAVLFTPFLSYGGDATFFGTGIGAVVGGIAGSQFGRGGGNAAATGIGIVGGAVVGNQIGQSIENANRTHNPAAPYASYDDAYNRALPPGYTPNYVAPPAPMPIYGDSVYQQLPDGSWRALP